ncbi:MAG: glycosyl transferase, family 2 [Solirubrobacterales bacterium]|nr:glycosyl transferase, family 2 [Solirubrobacterales bacterium]
MDASDVTFAVLNYNGRALLEGLLPTIDAQTASGFRVTVVDNGSTDDSVAWLAEHWPDVHVVGIPENIGVTRALNRAMQSAQTEYVALLNNDMELQPDWLAAMRGTLEAHPECGSADGKLLNFHRRGEIDGAGDLVARTGECSKRGFGEDDHGQFDRPSAILCASGGAALYRRAAFEHVGPFDEDFGAYYEDTDWGLRAQLCGYGCRYVPTAVAFHMGSATTSRDKPAYAHLFSRNSLLMLGKCLPAGSLLRLGPLLLAFQLKWLLASTRDGMLKAHLRGWAQAARLLPQTLRKRRVVQALRTVSPATLHAAMTPVNWRLEPRVPRD